MELRLGFDEALIRRYESRGANPLIDIHWRHGQTVYPAADWLDFGLVIMGWWFGAAYRLLHGSREEVLSFMDGPYALTLRRDGPVLRISARGSDEQWTTPLGDLVAELLRAAEFAVVELRRLGVAQTQQKDFEQGIPWLREALDRYMRAQSGPRGGAATAP